MVNHGPKKSPKRTIFPDALFFYIVPTFCRSFPTWGPLSKRPKWHHFTRGPDPKVLIHACVGKSPNKRNTQSLSLTSSVVVGFSPFVLASLINHKGLCLEVVARLFKVDRFVQIHTLVAQFLPPFTFNLLVDSVSILIHQRRFPSIVSHSSSVDEVALSTIFSSSKRWCVRSFTHRGIWRVRAEIRIHHQE